MLCLFDFIWGFLGFALNLDFLGFLFFILFRFAPFATAIAVAHRFWALRSQNLFYEPASQSPKIAKGAKLVLLSKSDCLLCAVSVNLTETLQASSPAAHLLCCVPSVCKRGALLAAGRKCKFVAVCSKQNPRRAFILLRTVDCKRGALAAGRLRRL